MKKMTRRNRLRRNGCRRGRPPKWVGAGTDDDDGMFYLSYPIPFCIMAAFGI